MCSSSLTWLFAWSGLLSPAPRMNPFDSRTLYILPRSFHFHVFPKHQQPILSAWVDWLLDGTVTVSCWLTQPLEGQGCVFWALSGAQGRFTHTCGHGEREAGFWNTFHGGSHGGCFWNIVHPERTVSDNVKLPAQGTFASSIEYEVACRASSPRMFSSWVSLQGLTLEHL